MQQNCQMVHMRMSWPMMNVMVWRVPTSGEQVLDVRCVHNVALLQKKALFRRYIDRQ